jgi:hypothetical protein
MPKRPNAKKLAAKEMRKQDSLASVEAGELLVARVVKGLGFCQFQLEGPGKIELKGLVRGLLKGGGANSSTRVLPGCYVFLTCTEAQAKKSPKTIWEISGVANRRDEVQRLMAAGRLPPDLDLDGLDELFATDESVPDTNIDIWADANPKKKRAAQMQAEAASQMAELLVRYRKAQAGEKSQVATCLHAERHEDDETPERPEEAEEAFALWDAAESAEAPAAGSAPSGKRQITSKRRLAALAAAEAAAAAPEELARALAWAAANAEFEREQAALAELNNRVVPTTWEDELDIDAI